MTVSDWLTLTALVLGPLFGVWLARHLQNRAFSRERRMDIFRMLMRTRRTRLYPEHVGALNRVEIEFAHDGQVIHAWRELFRHLGSDILVGQTRKFRRALARKKLASAISAMRLGLLTNVRTPCEAAARDGQGAGL